MERFEYEEISRWFNANKVVKANPIFGLDAYFPRLFMWEIDKNKIRIVGCHGLNFDKKDIPYCHSHFFVITKERFDAIELLFNKNYRFPELFPVEKVADLMKLFKERIPGF